MNRVGFKVWLYDSKCWLLKSLRMVQALIRRPLAESKYLFVLCPPYCGSTLLQELLSSSSNVSPNNIFGTREGQSLPEFRKLVDYRRTWEEDYQYPWRAIEMAWRSYWDRSKPILLDKSPANLIRVEAINQHFPRAYFVAMVRHPFAHCESLIRRDKMDAEAAARFALRCLKAQANNHQKKVSLLLIRYEDLVDQAQKIRRDLERFLPEISDIELNKAFKAHNFKNRRLPLTNLNEEKIKRLSETQKGVIRQVFAGHEKLLRKFGYSLIN